MKLILILIILPLSLFAEHIPRHVIAFWDSIVDKSPDDCLVHRTLEMPLNYLGMDVIYHDIQKPLPAVSAGDEIRGIVICFQLATKMGDPKTFIEWAVDAIDKGKKIVIMRNPGFLSDLKGNYTSGDLQNRLFEKLGFVNSQVWVEYPFDYKVLSNDNELTPFEQKLPYPLHGFYICRAYDPSAKSYLKVGIPGKPESESDLIILGTHGAYVSEFYGNSFDNLLFTSNPRSLGWHLNPFRLFEQVFDLSAVPKPDATTLAGRRIYFATCHGDSWNLDTAMEEYAGKNMYCSEVLLEKVIKPNPDLPIAVGVVGADLDPDWAARKKSQEITRKYFELNQVEASSHTYSHPFYWDFFRTGGPEKEIDYLYLYPFGTWQNSLLSWVHAKSFQVFQPKEFAKKKLKWGYAIPRAYANERFDLNKEISGAVDYLNQFAPEYNKIKLLIWSGDSRPWEEPVSLTKKAGIKNFGGGFVRFDTDYPSNLFVYPLARKVGGLIQLYAAANADNGYTSEWKETFYGYQFLPETLKNLDIPRRLKPIHLYYHSYSGEFKESVEAILSNISYIRTQSFIPIQVGRYCDIGEGFFSTEIEPLGADKWKIRNRKGLQTIRFDYAADRIVDFSNSTGVIGCIEHQGSLYVYLDAAQEEAIIAINQKGGNAPYLIDSTWEISNLKREGNSLNFNAKGWGKLSMRWKMPGEGSYSVSAARMPAQRLITSEGNILNVELDLPYNTQAEIKIEPTS